MLKSIRHYTVKYVLVNTTPLNSHQRWAGVHAVQVPGNNHFTVKSAAQIRDTAKVDRKEAKIKVGHDGGRGDITPS
jgi:hypothetical protein